MDQILFLVYVGLAWFVLWRILTKVTVMEYEQGLLYIQGKFVKILPPGQYLTLSYYSVLEKIDMRPRVVTISGQEIITADHVALKMSLAVQYQIINPVLAVNQVEKYADAVYMILQLNLREVVSPLGVDEFLKDKKGCSEKIFSLSQDKLAAFGVKLLIAEIKDVMFPGELKKVFAQVVQAQKEGLAILERARGETAALRHLANAAKMVEDNPALLQLRALQGTGNALVFGNSSGIAPIQKMTKDQNK